MRYNRYIKWGVVLIHASYYRWYFWRQVVELELGERLRVMHTHRTTHGCKYGYEHTQLPLPHGLMWIDSGRGQSYVYICMDVQ